MNSPSENFMIDERRFDAYRIALSKTWAHSYFSLILSRFIGFLLDNNATFYEEKFVAHLRYTVSAEAIITLSSFFEQRKSQCDNLSLHKFLNFIKAQPALFPSVGTKEVLGHIEQDINILTKHHNNTIRLISIRDKLLAHLDKRSVINVHDYLKEQNFTDKIPIELMLIAKEIISKYSKFYDKKLIEDIFPPISISEIENAVTRMCKVDHLVKLAARSIEWSMQDILRPEPVGQAQK